MLIAHLFGVPVEENLPSFIPVAGAFVAYGAYQASRWRRRVSRRPGSTRRQAE